MELISHPPVNAINVSYEADRVLMSIHKQILDNRFEGFQMDSRYKFGGLVKEYLKYAEANKKPSTYRADIKRMNNLTKHFNESMPISSFNNLIIEKFKQERLKKAKPATVNRDIVLLKGMFTMAIKWNWCQNNPVKTVKILREAPFYVHYFTFQEEKNIISESPEWMAELLTVAIQTGMRRGELLHEVTGRNIDFEKRIITIPNSKSGKPRMIPMSKKVYEILQKNSKNSKKKDSIFPYKDDKVTSVFRRIRNRAGMNKLRFHDLRHLFGRRMINAGVDIVTLKELMGHASIITTSRYIKPTWDNKVEAIRKLENLQRNCNILSKEEGHLIITP